MKVVQLLEVVNVPDDYERCSVCGKYHPIEMFNNDNSKTKTRTNCFECYNMPFVEMTTLKEQTNSLYKTNDYKELCHSVSRENEIRNAAVTKEELLENLESFIQEIKNLPDDIVFVESSYDDYYGVSFEKPCFSNIFIKADSDFPYGYPKEIDGLKVYINLNH